MKSALAWSILLLLAAGTAAALLLPWPAVLGLAVAAVALMRRRAGFLAFAAATVAINALLLAWLEPGPERWSLGGAGAGATAGLRIVAVLGVNLAALQRLSVQGLVEALRLPRRVYAFIAAVAVAAQDVGRDFRRLVEARRLTGDWPRGRLGQVRSAAVLMPALFVAAQDRATRRREALWLVGHDTGPAFAPIVAVTALAIAGRLALVALPNVALTYLIVFLAGVVFGAAVGFWGGFWSMLLTDLMISGLTPMAFVNVPAMALLGLLGGTLTGFSGRDGVDRWAGRMFAAVAGIAGTLLFSVAADTLSWALIAENRASLDRLRIGILAGLAFNAVPALVNGVLFFLAVEPVARACQALRQARPSAPADQAAPLGS